MQFFHIRRERDFCGSWQDLLTYNPDHEDFGVKKIFFNFSPTDICLFSNIKSIH